MLTFLVQLYRRYEKPYIYFSVCIHNFQELAFGVLFLEFFCSQFPVPNWPEISPPPQSSSKGFLIEFQRVSHQVPKGFSSSSQGFLIVFPRVSHRVPKESSSSSQGFLIKFPRVFHQVLNLFPKIFHIL